MVMPARETSRLMAISSSMTAATTSPGTGARTIDNQQIAVVNTRIDHGIAGHLHNKQRGLVRHGL